MKNKHLLALTLHVLLVDFLNNQGIVKACRHIIFEHRLQHKALQGHALRTVKAKDIDNCQLKCYLENNCVSVNFAPSGNCDLNNMDHTQKPDDLAELTDNIYSSIINPCASSPCQNPDTVCQVGFTDRGYRCECNKTGFVGEQCEKAVLRIFVKLFGTQDKPGGQSQFGPTVIEVNGINYCKRGRGHNIVTVYPNGSIHASMKFDTFGSQAAVAGMTAFINGLPENLMVLIAVHDSTKGNFIQNTAGAESALYSLGAVAPVLIAVRESWLLIGFKGAEKPTWIQQRHAARNAGPVSLGTEIIF